MSRSSPEYHREWRRRHPEKQAEYSARYRAKVRDTPEYKARVKETNRKQRERVGQTAEFKAEKAAWQSANLDRLRMAGLKHRLARRAAMIAAYGGKCACCGESEATFLTLDHKNGDGAADRRAFRTSHNAGRVRLLQLAGWPQEGYQLLCWNCQYGTYRMPVCPHKV